MILNSIGFIQYSNAGNQALYYTINSGIAISVQNLASARDANNLRWVTLNRSVTTGDVLKVITFGGGTGYATASTNSGTNVQFTGMSNDLTKSNSNIRVTPLGASVAPEPGTFALALTGGATLIGICIRRRRNAA